MYQRIGMDVTHFRKSTLTLINYSSSCFTLWNPLPRQDSASFINQLEAIFLWKGAAEWTAYWQWRGVLLRKIGTICKGVPTYYRGMGTWKIPSYDKSYCDKNSLFNPGGSVLAQRYAKGRWNGFNSVSQPNLHLKDPFEGYRRSSAAGWYNL